MSVVADQSCPNSRLTDSRRSATFETGDPRGGMSGARPRAHRPPMTEATVEHVDMKLESVTIPVADVDRAKAFYEGLGWRLDADLGGGDFRIVQLTPPGSACSVQFGTGLTSATPGAAQNLLVVSDIEAAQGQLVAEHA